MIRVGFIGLGSQGGPMARRILEEGFPTTLWARRSQSLAPFAGTDAAVAATPAELAASSDLVALCVLDDEAVTEVMTGKNGILAGLAPGGTVAIHATTRPATCRTLAEVAAGSGVTVLDAPVSGGGGAATARRLLVMVGGERGAFDRARVVFESFGDPVLHLGPVGSGQTAKLVNNLAFTAQLALAAEAYALAARAGVDPERMAEVLRHGSGQSAAAEILSRSGYTLVNLASGAGPLLHKDVRLAADLTEESAATATPLWQAASSALSAMGHPLIQGPSGGT